MRFALHLKDCIEDFDLKEVPAKMSELGKGKPEFVKFN